jgi:hypothetical protein
MRPADITNQRFGRLVAIEATDKRVSGKVMWRCICDCGVETISNVQHLREGRRVSCGCAREAGRQIKKKTPKHGHYVGDRPTAIYRIWSGMLTRCFNQKMPQYHNYGGRGITVCERWRQFENFLADMGERPPGMTLDRYPDNDGNYEPGNCRWATMKEQSRNKRSNRLVTHDGKTATVAEWGERTGIDRHTIGDRIVKSGWSEERALTAPLMT